MKKKKVTTTASEIAIHLSLEVVIPDKPEYQATGRIVLNSKNVGKIVLDQL